MDPKLSQLDPKLKEAYDRVMNGQGTPANQNPAPAPATPQPQVQPPPSIISQQYQPQPAPTVQAPQMEKPIPVVNPVQPTPAPTQSTSQAPTPQTPPAVQNLGGAVAFNAAGTAGATVVKKSGGKIMHALLAMGVVVFLLAYTFMWIWIFKIKVPFISS